MFKKYKKIISYLLLLLISTQTALAGVDLHMIYEKDTSIDISHHYIDEHSEQFSCDIDSSENMSKLPVSEHNEGSHHGCSGHVTLFSFNLSNCFKSNYLPQEVIIHKITSFITIKHSPLFRPPIS
jgi:hypothetical protein